MKAVVVALLLALLPASLDAGNLMRINVLHEHVRGRPQQTITVFFWPEPEDRVLHLIAVDPDHERTSSVRLYGIESSRAHIFVWHLPRTVIREEATEPYTVTAVTADAEGRITGSVQTKFYVY